MISSLLKFAQGSDNKAALAPDAQASVKVPSYMTANQQAVTTPEALPLAERTVTTLQPEATHALTPVAIANIPNVGNSCFISASLQFFAAFLDAETLENIRQVPMPSLPEALNESPASRRRCQLAQREFNKAKRLFCTLVIALKSSNNRISHEQVAEFVGCLRTYTLLVESRYTELFCSESDFLKEKLDGILSTSSSNKLSSLETQLTMPLQQQDATEFIGFLQELFSLHRTSPLCNTSTFKYKRITGIHFEEGVDKAEKMTEETPNLFLNFPVEKNIHTKTLGYDLGDILAHSLLSGAREQRVSRAEAHFYYTMAGKTLPADYDETCQRECYVATHLSVPPTFQNLLITLGLFEFSEGAIRKRQDEAGNLLITSNGRLPLAGLIDRECSQENSAQEREVPDASKVGEITAILCHQGTDAHNGHYVTLRKINNQWYLFDDQFETEAGILLEDYLRAQYTQTKLHDIKGFNGVACFIQQGATPYVLAVDFKDTLPCIQPLHEETGHPCPSSTLPVTRKRKRDASDDDDCFITSATPPAKKAMVLKDADADIIDLTEIQP